MEFDFIQRYNLTTGNWSTVSFLEWKVQLLEIAKKDFACHETQNIDYNH